MNLQRLLTLSALVGLVFSPAIQPAASRLTPAILTLVPAAGQARRPEGVSAQWWSAVQADIRRSEYRVTWQDHTYLPDLPAAYQAPNRAQNLRTYFPPGGIRVIPRIESTPSWEWGLRLARYGSVGHLQPAVPARLVAQGDRVEYRRGDLTEWYVNDERGLEQGFTIYSPIRPGSSVRLVLEFTLSGNLTPVLTHDGQSVDFTAPNGAHVLRYAELHAQDAADRSLSTHMSLSPHTLHLIVDTTSADYPITVDPVLTTFPVPNWATDSNQANAHLGNSVATAGDVNSDGFADVIIGAFEYDNGEANEGRAFAYHGSASGLSTTPDWTAEGDQEGASFGNSLGTAGDVNGDGYSDAIVGGLSERAFVYFGSAAGLSATPNWTAETDQAGSGLGNSVGTAGDVNGDGYDDVIVGAPSYSNGQIGEGRAFVYFGSAAGLSTTPNWMAEGNQFNALFGSSVGAAGDVNGDGYGDIIVGAIFYADDERSQGAAFVYHGSGFGLSMTPNWTAEDDQDVANFGTSVGTAGDVNGDGFADVIVGAYLFSNGQVPEGGAFVYHGSPTGLSTSSNWTAESDQQFAGMGNSVGTAGDVNGDGFADVIVGAIFYQSGQLDEGAAFVYYGSAAGLPMAVDDMAYSVTYDGWSGAEDALASGGGYRAASTAGQMITWKTTREFDQVTLITYRGPDQGLAQVFIDGVYQGTLDLYAPAPEYQYQVMYGGLPLSRHLIQVRVLGQKDPASTGTEMRVDGFQVGTVTIDDNQPAVSYNAWNGKTGLAYSGSASLHFAAVKNASVFFDFTGAQFTWITARGPAFGQADVVVDGVSIATVDLYNPTGEAQYPQVVGGLADGAHSVQIRVLGTHNPSSTGNTIAFDGFSVP